MRRRNFAWTFLVLSLVLTIYGGYVLIYHHLKENKLSYLGLAFFIFGVVLLISYIVLFTISLIQKKKLKTKSKEVVIDQKTEENPSVAPVKEDKKQESISKEKPVGSPCKSYYVERSSYTSSGSSYSDTTAYVKLVGFGPILRVECSAILDMRNNIYYRIEGNIVHRSGSGPVFEISGNRIRLAFGSYLYEISGSNVNKIYGGYYASFSGGYLTTHDLKEKYEITDSLSLKQKLAVVALLFTSD